MITDARTDGVMQLLAPYMDRYDVSITWHNKSWTVRFIRWGKGQEMLHFVGEHSHLLVAVKVACNQLAVEEKV